MIIESSLASVAARAQQMYPFLPMMFLITQKYDTAAKVKSIRIPKLILHGRNDEVISFKHGQVIFKAAVNSREFLPFNGGHNDEVYVTSSAYKEKLQNFLLQNGL